MPQTDLFVGNSGTWTFRPIFSVCFVLTMNRVDTVNGSVYGLSFQMAWNELQNETTKLGFMHPCTKWMQKRRHAYSRVSPRILPNRSRQNLILEVGGGGATLISVSPKLFCFYISMKWLLLYIQIVSNLIKHCPSHKTNAHKLNNAKYRLTDYKQLSQCAHHKSIWGSGGTDPLICWLTRH